MKHKNLQLIHRMENWVYANDAARTGATGLLAEDVGKIAYQSDNQTYWRLINHSPVTWSAVTTGGPQGIPGNDGNDGPPGNDGAPGSVWRNGSGAPSNGLGINGDYYLNTTNGDVYLKTTGTYAVVANLTGPAGSGGGMSWVSPPASASSSGTAGQLAYDSTGIYLCYATNSWMKFTGTTAFGMTTVARNYASDGDTNGVLYFVGQNFDVLGVWTNPYLASRIDVVHSPVAAVGGPEHFVNRNLDHSVFLQNAANDFIGVDLGLNRTLIPTYYSMRARDDDGTNLPRNFKLQGTNSVSANTEAGFNAATWTDLDVRVGNTLMNAASAWGSFPVSGVVTPYRYLRVLQNGTNSSGLNYFCVQELELYGSFTYIV